MSSLLRIERFEGVEQAVLHGEGWHVIERRAYANAADTIDALDLLCSVSHAERSPRTGLTTNSAAGRTADECSPPVRYRPSQ